MRGNRSKQKSGEKLFMTQNLFDLTGTKTANEIKSYGKDSIFVIVWCS
jgi:hypothetical protein